MTSTNMLRTKRPTGSGRSSRCGGGPIEGGRYASQHLLNIVHQESQPAAWGVNTSLVMKISPLRGTVDIRRPEGRRCCSTSTVAPASTRPGADDTPPAWRPTSRPDMPASTSRPLAEDPVPLRLRPLARAARRSPRRGDWDELARRQLRHRQSGWGDVGPPSFR